MLVHQRVSWSKLYHFLEKKIRLVKRHLLVVEWGKSSMIYDLDGSSTFRKVIFNFKRHVTGLGKGYYCSLFRNSQRNMFDYRNLLKMADGPKENLPDRFPMSDSPCLPNMGPNLANRLRNVESYTGWWCNVPILKNDGVKVNGFRMTTHIWWKIKFMFETTNQLLKVVNHKKFIVDARAGIVSGEHNPDISPIRLVFFHL